MISIRLLSNDNNYANILTEILNDHRFGLDIALYELDRFDSSILSALRDMDCSRKSMHLNSYHYTADDMILGLSHDGHHSFLRDVALASHANISSAVLHWNKGRSENFPSKNRMAEVLSIFEQKDILPHIENLAVDFDWQRRLIEVAIKSGRSFGVCFDIGHAKIWGGKPIGVWLSWLDDLYAHEIPLIFHLHCNRGGHDDHLPLWMENMDCEISSVLSGFALDGVLPEIKAFPSRFPNATFVLETKAEFAMENIRWAREHLLGDVSVPG